MSDKEFEKIFNRRLKNQAREKKIVVVKRKGEENSNNEKWERINER